MATKAAVWGIDVGQCALKAIKLQSAGDKVEVLAFDTVEHEKILSHPEADAPALIKSAVEKFLSRNDIKGDLVAVAVPGQQTLSRFTKLPPVEQKRIPDIVKFEAGQQIPFDMDEVIWDYQTFSEPDSPDVEVGIFAIRKELIRAHLQYFTDAGIEPMLVQPSPLALYNAIRYDMPKLDKATILLDIGATATDLIVMEGSTIWSRPVPIGGNAFTEALVKSFKLSHAKAENLKRTAATTKYARQIFQAMRPVFADLISEIQRSIGFYTATHRESEIARILGVGNAFKLPGLQKFMQQNLQIEVDRFTAFSRVAPTAVSRNPQFEEVVPSMAVAFGLALQGMGEATISSSLLPPEIAKQIVWRKKQPYFAAAAACLLGAAGVIWFSNHRAGEALAGITGGQNVNFATPEQAESALLTANAATDGSGPYANKVHKAAEWLHNEFKKYENPQGPAQNLAVIKSLSEFNAIIPRIIQAVHVGFGKQVAGIRGASTSDEYLAKLEEAKRKKTELLQSGMAPSSPQILALDQIIDRKRRNEIWIRKLSMAYYDTLSSAPEASGLTTLSERDRGDLGKPGWVVRIEGQCTMPKPVSGRWIERDVLGSVVEEGRREKRGFYFLATKLLNLDSVPEDDRGTMVQQPPFGGPAGRSGPGRVGFGPPGNARGPGFPPPGGQPGQPAPGQGPKRFEPEEGTDPLTQEKYTGSDSVFIVDLVVVRGDAPSEILATTQPAAPAGDAAKAAEPSNDERRR